MSFATVRLNQQLGERVVGSLFERARPMGTGIGGTHIAATSILPAQTLPVAAAEKQPVVVVGGRTIVAFFPPVTNAELQKDADTNEALADFRLCARQVREPLKKSGIEFHELYTRSFRVRVGKAVTTFRATKDDVGYYLIVPGKKPRIEYGVMTDADLLQIANEYFKGPAK